LATAHFAIRASAQDQTSGVAESPVTAKVRKSIEEEFVKYPLKEPDTSSPRATLQSFLHNINRAYAVLMAAHRKNIKTPGLLASDSVSQMERHAEILFQRSAFCLNLSGVPDELKQDVGYEGAIKLKEIFDRIELPPFEKIPDLKAVRIEEEPEKVTELIRWRLPNTGIIITRVEEGPRKGAFLFEEATVARLDEFYGKVKDLPYKRGEISYGFLDFYTTTPGLLLPPKWNRWLPSWSTAIYFKQPIYQWIGLAIGFGAQTLVRDIFAGIFFLMDDAIRVGDYIEVGTMKGRVEHISVRSLRLRHPRGMLITIPFGDMPSVTNYTRDYVIMKLDFRVRYDTNVDKVRKIIKKINKEIQKDEELSRGLLDKIKSQGVREMDDSAMIMRVKFMCVPGEQFVLRREVYRRIQEAFQKNGIEFAHRNVTVYFPPDSAISESDSQPPGKKAESETRDQKKKKAAAAVALRTVEEEQTPEDKAP